MPNYSLIVDARFRPFSYDELLKPALMQTQAHEAIAEEYSNLATKANVWDAMANEQTDPYAYKMYKTYSDDLAAQADQLMKYGLNTTSRKGMYDMRSRYSKEILPIENAYKRREELATEQRKALMQNPTLRYQRMASQMSLDDFIKNPSLDYGQSYSGALLTQQVGQAASNLQKVLTDKSQLKRLGLPYQYERMLQYGATPSQVIAAMADRVQNEPETATFLRGIVDGVLQSSGVAEWADPATLAEFRAFANQGLYNALGQAKIDNFADQFSMQSALKSMKGKSGSGEYQEERLPYRLGDSLNTKNVKESKISKEDLEFLRRVKANPSMIRESKQEVGTTDASITLRHTPGEHKYATPSNKSYPNYNRLKQIEQKYGISVSGGVRGGDSFTLKRQALDNLISTVETRSENSGVLDHLWIGNTADNSWVVEGINENIRSYKAQHGKADIFKFEDGKRGDRLSSKDLDRLTSNSGSYYTFIDDNNKVRFVMTYKDSDNKEQAVEVGLNTVGGRALQERANAVSEALRIGDTRIATLEMDNVHRIIDGLANTRAMNQAKSSSKINLPRPINYDDENYLNMVME